jgi:hypothetical protein
VSLPIGIGPHEGREFDLMRTGAKDVAYFSEIEPEGLAEISANPLFLTMTFRSREILGISVPCWIICRQGCAAQAKRLKELVLNPPAKWNAHYEREVGRILGYRDCDIDAFIAHVGAR